MTNTEIQMRMIDRLDTFMECVDGGMCDFLWFSNNIPNNLLNDVNTYLKDYQFGKGRERDFGITNQTKLISRDSVERIMGILTNGNSDRRVSSPKYGIIRIYDDEVVVLDMSV